MVNQPLYNVHYYIHGNQPLNNVHYHIHGESTLKLCRLLYLW